MKKLTAEQEKQRRDSWLQMELPKPDSPRRPLTAKEERLRQEELADLIHDIHPYTLEDEMAYRARVARGLRLLRRDRLRSKVGRVMKPTAKSSD